MSETIRKVQVNNQKLGGNNQKLGWINHCNFALACTSEHWILFCDWPESECQE